MLTLNPSNPALVQPVLTVSQNGVLVYSAVRNANRLITDLRLTMLNAVAERDLGKEAIDVLGQLFSQLFPKPIQVGLFDRFRQVLDLSQSARFEFQYTLAGQPEPDWLDVSVVPIEDSIVVSYNAITARKKLEEIARQQAQLLAGILEGVPVGIAVLKAIRTPARPTGRITDFRIVRINSAFRSAFAPSSSEVTNQHLSAFFPQVWESGLLSRCIMCVETGQLHEFGMPLGTTGNTHWYKASITPESDQLILSLTDITQTRRDKLAHHFQAELLQSISDNTPVGLVLWEAVRDDTSRQNLIDFRYRMANRMDCHLTGKAEEELIGNDLLTLFPRFRGTELETVLRDTLETGHTHRLLFTYYTDQPNRWFDAQFNRIGSGQSANAVLMTYMDVTEQHNAELTRQQQQQALEIANLNLRRSNENLEQFAFIASHDLQEPLRKIQSFGGILATNYESVLDEVGQDMIRRMQGSAERMSMHIRDLLTYSRLATHRAPNEHVMMGDLLSRVLGDLAVRIQETGAVINVDDLPDVTGDQRQLEQLMINLLSNALKFRQADVAPVIRVFGQRVSASAVPFGVIPPENTSRYYAEINVTDNGIGFNEKYLDRIFQVFQRLHGKSEYMGTGVGLAICRKVADNHGGGITASSQPGGGATFRVYLPLEETK